MSSVRDRGVNDDDAARVGLKLSNGVQGHMFVRDVGSRRYDHVSCRADPLQWARIVLCTQTR
jgi:hypothetical protein